MKISRGATCGQLHLDNCCEKSFRFLSNPDVVTHYLCKKHLIGFTFYYLVANKMRLCQSILANTNPNFVMEIIFELALNCFSQFKLIYTIVAKKSGGGCTEA